jgi:Entner-Doudoroff aldolase
MDEILERIAEIGIVPVVKIDSSSQAADLAAALAAGGIPCAEVTFRTAAAAEAIAAMRDAEPSLLVGAGTVTSAAVAKAAVEAGAAFVVSPAWDEGVVDFCLERGVAVLPGVSGPDGVARGLAKGLGALKFFPAEASGGVAMLDALAGPFAAMRFVPTGGIDAGNIGDYARHRQVLAVGGSWMVKSELIASGDWASIERLCREAVLALHGFRFAHVGVNHAEAAEAADDATRLAALFGMAPKEGASSIFMSGAIELMKSQHLGEKGHIAIRCNSVERGLAYLKRQGINALGDTIRSDGAVATSAYLDLSIGGFALHLVRA